jgi:hypothetical protein
MTLCVETSLGPVVPVACRSDSDKAVGRAFESRSGRIHFAQVRTGFAAYSMVVMASSGERRARYVPNRLSTAVPSRMPAAGLARPAVCCSHGRMQ